MPFNYPIFGYSVIATLVMYIMIAILVVAVPFVFFKTAKLLRELSDKIIGPKDDNA